MRKRAGILLLTGVLVFSQAGMSLAAEDPGAAAQTASEKSGGGYDYPRDSNDKDK